MIPLLLLSYIPYYTLFVLPLIQLQLLSYLIKYIFYLDMRLYTALQAKLAKLANIGEYTFKVESKDIEGIDEWIVAAITFPDEKDE